MKKTERQPFFLSFGLSLFVLLTAAGLVAVDTAGRRLSFGDQRPAFQTKEAPNNRVVLQICLMGKEKELDITEIDKFWNFFLDFSCIPHN